MFESATAGLQQSCNLLFIVAFILIPVTFMKFRLGLPFLVSVFVVVMLVLLIGIEFCCLHRGFYPEQRDERFQLWMLVGVMPQCSMRAVDELSKSFLVCAHPLAVAEVFLKETAFRRFRDAVIRDLEFPVPPTLNGSGSELALVAARRFREEFERPAVMEMAFKRVADPVQRLPEPEALETVSVKFCQRCLMPYEVAAQGCIDCGGVPLAGLEV